MISASDMGALLLAETTIAALGFGLATWLLPNRPVWRTEVLGLSLILGSGVLSLLLFGLAWVVKGKALVVTITAISLVAGIAGFRRSRHLELAPFGRGRDLIFAWVPILFLFACQAAIHPLYADGLFNFEIRAQLAAAHGGLIPPAFYSDAARAWMHPDYPIFLPLNQAWVYLCAGRAQQSLVMLLGAHFAAAGWCLLYAGVARITGQSWRANLAVALLVLLPTATMAPGGAASLWADFPLAVAFLGAVLYFVEFASTGRGLGCLAAFLALLPWIKREGVVLAGIVIVVAGYLAWKRGTLRQLLPALLPTVAIIVGWKVFLAAVHVNAGRDFLPVTPDNLLAHVDRVPFIVTAVVRELFAWERWCVLWPMTLVAVVVLARNETMKPWKLLAPLIAVPLAIYSFIYIFSAWDSLPLHVVTSLPRLLLPLSMPAILAVVVATPRIGDGQSANKSAN